jgi:hypothetical protein
VLLGGCFTDPPAESADTSTGGGSSTSTTATTTSDDDPSATSLDTGTTTSTSADPSTTSSEGTDASSSSGAPELPDGEVLFQLYDMLCAASIVSYEDPECGTKCDEVVECDVVATQAGHAASLPSVTLENAVEGERVIEFATWPTDTGLLTARFEGLTLANATAPRLRTTVWCGDAADCLAWWQVEVTVGVGEVPVVEGIEVMNNAGADVDIDLSPWAGEVVGVTLRMSNHGTFQEGDRIRFEDPRLVDTDG